MRARDMLLRERIARHGFATRPSTDVVAAAARTAAIQAQDDAAAALGVRARAVGISADDVRQAVGDRTVARTWLMRATIHLVPAVDLRWLVRLIGPSVQRRQAVQLRRLGLTSELLDRVVEALPAVLADGPLTRHEVRAGLADHGVLIEHDDPAVATHVLIHASSLGLVCRGPERGRDKTFVLLDDWLAGTQSGPSGDDALAELARRYFTAYSPATAADFGAWSGLAAAAAVTLVRDELTPCDVDGRPGYRLGEVEPARGVRLLPAFDNYLIGYADRAAMIDRNAYGRVYQGGMIRSTVLVDGRVAGVWALDRARDRVTVTPFERLSNIVVRALEREVADVGRFLGRHLQLDVDIA